MPATNGSRIRCSSHNSATNTPSVATQNTTCRLRFMPPPLSYGHDHSRVVASMTVRLVEVAYPLADVEPDREQGQDGNQSHEHSAGETGVESEAEGGQHEAGIEDLRDGVELGYWVRLHRQRIADEPRQHDPADDHDVARDNQDDQPTRDRLGGGKRDVDRHDQRLVRQRIEVGADLAGHAEALGQESVDRVAHAGSEENEECDAHLAPP